MVLDVIQRSDLQDDSYRQHPITHPFWFRVKVSRTFGSKNASGSLGSALVGYEQQRRVG
jgi:hypothetical protein